MNAARYSWIALLGLAVASAEETPRDEMTPPPAPPKKEGEAGPDKGPGGPGGGKGQGREALWRMVEAWKKADTNQDGAISPDEFGGMERPGRLPEDKRAELFKRFDKNNDGKIDGEELPSGPPKRMEPLENADKNKDGKIDFEEFKTLEFVAKMPPERQEAVFKRMDRNGDGVLTREDRPHDGGGPRGGRGGGRKGNLIDMVKEHDKNGDGALDFAEFREIPWVKNDGEDAQEARFDEFDKNKDLKLDAADMPPPGEKPDRPGPGPERPDKPDRPEKPKAEARPPKRQAPDA